MLAFASSSCNVSRSQVVWSRPGSLRYERLADAASATRDHRVGLSRVPRPSRPARDIRRHEAAAGFVAGSHELHLDCNGKARNAECVYTRGRSRCCQPIQCSLGRNRSLRATATNLGSRSESGYCQEIRESVRLRDDDQCWMEGQAVNVWSHKLTAHAATDASPKGPTPSECAEIRRQHEQAYGPNNYFRGMPECWVEPEHALVRFDLEGKRGWW